MTGPNVSDGSNAHSRIRAHTSSSTAAPGPTAPIHWIECRGRVTVDAGGAPTGTIGVAIDVTAREQHAAAVVRELEEEHGLVENLQQAISRPRRHRSRVSR